MHFFLCDFSVPFLFCKSKKIDCKDKLTIPFKNNGKKYMEVLNNQSSTE